jgi:intracellular multiplication protein IcmL
MAEGYGLYYTRLQTAVLISLLVNLFMGSFLYYILTNPREPLYFASSINGQVAPLIPQDQPNQSDAAILQWANTAAIAVHTYDYVHYDEQFKAAQQYFTDDGWQAYWQAFLNTNTLDTIKSLKLTVTSVATMQPVMGPKGVIDGAYAWQVVMPLLVTFQGAGPQTQQRFIVTMTITRQSVLNSPGGIGISSFVEQTGDIV